MNASLPPEELECYRLIRGQIEFEATLVSQRLSWFVAAQAFLFSAYAITLNAPREAAAPAYPEQQRLLYHLIPVVAIGSCTLIYLAILGGLFAQVELRHFLARRLPAERLQLFPPLQGKRNTHLLGMAAPLGLPLLFMVVWVFLFTRGLR